MKIESMRVGLVEAPLKRPFKTALRTTSTIRSTVLQVRTGAGTAWGSAAATPAITGDTEEAILADLATACRTLSGADVQSPAEALAALPQGSAITTASALAAVDVALHDVAAQAAGVPLVEHLGGTAGALATSDTTISVDTPQVMAAQAADAVAEGFAVLKVKVGSQPEHDLERLQAVRDAAPEVRLLVDANQGWSAVQAIEIITAIEQAGIGIELVEQPVARHDLDALAQVTAAVATPILADEAVFSPADAERLIEMRAADMINVKLMKSGGLVGARRILDLAAQAQIPCMVGAMMESTIGIGAALSLACAHEAVTLIDLDPPLLIGFEPVRGALRVDGAELHTLPAPGLGITEVEGVTWLD